MKKSASKKSDKPASSNSSETPGNLQVVKGIKNTVFKAIPIGGSGIVAGVVRGASTESGTYGDYWKFKGDFAARVGSQTYKSATLYLPEVAADLLANAFLAAKDALPEVPEGGKEPIVSLEFKIRIRKEPDPDNERNKNGFVWVAEPVKEIAPEQDKVLALLAG